MIRTANFARWQRVQLLSCQRVVLCTYRTSSHSRPHYSWTTNVFLGRAFALVGAAASAFSLQGRYAQSGVTEKHKFIIDCDAGIDDAQALVTALCSEKCEVLAITTVMGNVGLDQVVTNVKRTLLACDMYDKVPLYRGAATPLIFDRDSPVSAEYWHGEDGLGDVPHAHPSLASIPKDSRKRHLENINEQGGLEAIQAIIKLVRENPGEITIVALGPLTNIALAVQMAPDLPNLVKSFVFMGGSENARGNRTYTAEYNTFSDPEAAYICLNSFKESVMVSWDLTLAHGLDFSWCENVWFNKNTTQGHFLGEVSALTIKKSYNSPWREKGYLIPDPLAMCVALDEACVAKSETYNGTVSLSFGITRGQIVRDQDHIFGKPNNLKVVKEVNMDILRDLLANGTRST
eukprot:m.150115 g.150115  ORF g.150115 m.150115 type:complete len:404 (-) comp15021_c0_seq5:2184-3395(-)